MGRLGYFGGTFDPIHLGHVDLLSKMLERYPFEKIFVVPTGQNPHKVDPPEAAGQDRYKMVELSLEEVGDNRLVALDWEVKSSGPQYTIDTLRRFRKTFGEGPILLLGNEVFANFPKWKSPKEILQNTDVVVISREKNLKMDPIEITQIVGIDDTIARDEHAQRFMHSDGKHWIEFQTIEPLPFSATSLRHELHEKSKSEKSNILPQGIQRSVWLYVKAKQLYRR